MTLQGIPFPRTIVTLLLCGMAVAGRAQTDSVQEDSPCYPPIICSDSNRIGGNTAALEPFFRKLDALEKEDTLTVVSVLQIGDSHVQAGFFPGQVREQFQRDFGNAGRGLIVPLKLTGTNEPSDYAITSPNRWEGNTCIRQPGGEEVGMSGMALSSGDREIELNLKTKEPFDRIWAFHHREAPLLAAPDSLSDGICCPGMDNDEATLIPLSRPVTEIRLQASAADQAFSHPAFYGFSLENGNSGILYHSLGINGSTYTAMNRNPQIVRQAARLYPDLVIVSLGTNDCSGPNFNAEDADRQIARLIDSIRLNMPTSVLLLTTPMEYYRRVRQRGRTYRKLNPNACAMRDCILRRAAQYRLPVWDFYAAAGGDGAMNRWNDLGMTNTDKIHLSREGYQLQGKLLYDALLKAYNSHKQQNDPFKILLN